MEKEKILGFDVCNCNEQELIQDIMEDYNQNNQIMIANINPEIIINNYKDEAYIHNLNDQKYQIPEWRDSSDRILSASDHLHIQPEYATHLLKEPDKSFL